MKNLETFCKVEQCASKVLWANELKIGRNHSATSVISTFFLTFFLILFPLLFVFAIIERNTFYRCSKNTDHSTMIQNLYPKNLERFFFGLNRISFDLLHIKGQKAFKFSAKIYHKLCIFISKLLIVNILINETFFFAF